MKLELLYFDGCPNHGVLAASLRELADEHGIALRARAVETAQDAERERFLGSPSVRVNGVDVEPGAEQRTDYGLKCRLYRSATGHSGLPRAEWIRHALREAAP